MANSKRRENYTDRNGNMLIPINVEGGGYSESFITTPKLVCIALILGALAFIIYNGSENNISIGSWLVWIGMWLLFTVLATRFIIFEEKFYYRMYQELKEHEITTPALFWDIASIKDTDEGAIITYSDAKIAIIVKLERDTITGKSHDFKEIHYDAISDFYKSVIVNRYSFVQMNIMEQAGKDPRLAELEKIVYKSDNPNIQKLMEMEVGHIKNITHASLYESDYFLFYTQDLTKIDTIIMDITECLFKLLDGAYIAYTVLSSKDIVDLLKEEFGVNYFNSTEASLLMYNNNANSMINPFSITGIIWADGEEQTLNKVEKNKLRMITSGVIKETIGIYDMALKKSIYRKEEKNKVGIDFNSLSKPIQENNRRTIKSIRKPNKLSNANQDKNIDKAGTEKNKPAVQLKKDEYIEEMEVKPTQISVNSFKSSNNNDNDDEYIDL